MDAIWMYNGWFQGGAGSWLVEEVDQRWLATVIPVRQRRVLGNYEPQRFGRFEIGVELERGQLLTTEGNKVRLSANANVAVTLERER